METLNPPAHNAASYIVGVQFLDQNGTAACPATATWSLTTIDGQTIINGRSNVAFPNTLVSGVNYVTLSGEDLPTGNVGKTNILFTWTATNQAISPWTSMTWTGDAIIQVDTLAAIGNTPTPMELNWQGGMGLLTTVTAASNTPPGSPVLNAGYLVGSAPTGVWVGYAGNMAVWNGSEYQFFSTYIVFDGTNIVVGVSGVVHDLSIP
jgi:hypothetical protein